MKDLHGKVITDKGVKTKIVLNAVLTTVATLDAMAYIAFPREGDKITAVILLFVAAILKVFIIGCYRTPSYASKDWLSVADLTSTFIWISCLVFSHYL